MARLSQLVRKSVIRVKPRKKSRKTALKKCPQKSGICIAFFKDMSPKKPNSGNRKVAKIRLSTKRIIRAHVQGIKSELAGFKRVLIQGKRVRDLPGIQYRVISGTMDMAPVAGRRTSRSKYGVKISALKTSSSLNLDSEE